MFVALVSVTGESLYQEFLKQEQIVKIFTTAAEKVQQGKGNERDVRLLDITSCAVFNFQHCVTLSAKTCLMEGLIL